jgi:O-antigen/teichoic acid export membrane protein
MLLGAVLLTALAFPLTQSYGSIGALYAFTAAVILQLIPMLLIILRTCRKGTQTT